MDTVHLYNDFVAYVYKDIIFYKYSRPTAQRCVYFVIFVS